MGTFTDETDGRRTRQRNDVWQVECEDLCRIETGITFADVAGEEEAKDALKEIVDFLHKPEKYSEIGAVLPKGAC